MKILHIILSEGFAGSEKYTVDLINFQSEKNNCYLIKNKNNKSKDIYAKLTKNTKIFEINNFLKIFLINFIIHKIKPDIVHTHLGKSGQFILKRNFFKLIATLHMNYKKKNYLFHDALIVSNNTQKKQVVDTFKKKVKKIYLWGFTDERVTKNNNIVRQELGIPIDAYVFGSVGRFHFQKGFDIIIEAFKKINNKDIYLVLIGNNHDNFLQYQSKNIKILPHQLNVKNFYNSFDCFIMASRWETFGITLIEAMEMNLPIISTVYPGNSDWVNKHAIDTFKINNIDDLVRIMKNKLTKGKEKINYNLKEFEYKNKCLEIESFYKEI